MFTLLPEQQKKELYFHYRLRFFVVLLVVISISFFIGIFVFIPKYIDDFFGTSTIKLDIETTESLIKGAKSAELEGVISDTNLYVNILNNSNSSVISIIEKVLSLVPSGIKIEKISYTRGPDSLIAIEGLANTRDVLLSFSKKIKEQNIFTSSDLPISNLAKGTDIEFTMKLVGKF